MALSDSERKFLADARKEGYSNADITKYLLRQRGGGEESAPAASAPAPAVPASVPTSEPMGFGRSLWEGIKSTAGLGFADEIGGAANRAYNVLTGKGDTSPTMSQEIDYNRGKLAEAQQTHPLVTSFGGGVGLSPLALMAPAAAGAGVTTAAPAGLGARMAQGALAGYGQGAVQGAGDSNAPDLAGRVEGAEHGGNVGAAVGAGLPLVGAGVGKAAGAVLGKLKGAPDAMIDQRVGDIVGNKEFQKATATDRRIMAKAIEPIRDELSSDEGAQIAKVARKDPKGALELIKQRRMEYVKDRTADYKTIDSATGGVSTTELVSDLQKHVDALAENPGQETKENALTRIIDSIKKRWGSKETVPTVALRDYVTKLQNEADDTMGGLEETARYKLMRYRADAVKETLNRHIDNAASTGPDVAAAADRIRTMNRKVMALGALEEPLETRAANAAAAAVGGMSGVEKASIGVHAAVAAMGHPGLAIGSYAAQKAIPPLANAARRGATEALASPGVQRAADRALARLAVAKGNGGVTPDLIRQAIAAGARAETIQQIVGGP